MPEGLLITVTAICTLLTALFTTVGTIIGFRNKRAIQEVHLAVNSRLDQLVAATALSSHAAGVTEGQASAVTTGRLLAEAPAKIIPAA